MNELPFIFVAGFLGSSHCLGMCGPLAIALGARQENWSASLRRQLLYSVGRLFTYGSLGASAGYGGQYLASANAEWIRVPAMLSLVAGGFLFYQGLVAAGVIRRKAVGAGGPCLAGGLLSGLLRSQLAVDVFLSGLLTGFLPCGLVYGFLGLAAAKQDVLLGALTMVTFGLGTIPIMVATGCGGKLLSLAARRHLFRAAAWCLVFSGLWTMMRGTAYLRAAPFELNSATVEQSGEFVVEPDCPFCNED